MMKTIVSIAIIVCAGFSIFAQKETKPTTAFTIAGEVKSPLKVQTADLSKWKVFDIGDVVITNHLGEKRSEAKALKGVLLKDVLSSVEIKAESPRVLSQYYFVCKANDGYTIVYSWNELFNNPEGDAVYIVTEKNGQAAATMDDSILMLSPKDFKTGRRHLKALTTIDVRRSD